MTLMPVEPARLTIDPRRYSWCPKLVLPGYCEVPGCGSTFRLDPHHIVPRSRTGGPLDYVTVDGVVIRNVCHLCRVHHDQLTSPLGGHQASIRFVESLGWCWCLPFRPPGTPGLTGDDVACLAVPPAGVGALFRTARGGVWQVVGSLAGG